MTDDAEVRLSVPCAIAVEEFHRARKNVQRFWNLLYAVSATLTVTLIFALGHVIVGDTVAALVSGAGSVVSGGGFLVLRKLKDHAVDEQRRAQAAVRKDCGTSGTRGPGEPPGASGVPPEVLISLTES
ncbi:hypothetical protein ACIQ8D_01400 [Streptomyces sp. NPDC096094]|uniref:hypothetical protein n=1 Tax=Streptomyces sp. NPDC096094 TaxID=3366073 RepID=UPI00380AF0C8